MRKAVMTGKEKIEIQEVEKPKLGPKDILLRPAFCGICGSEVQMYKLGFHASYPEMKIVGGLGHELSGTIAEVGSEVESWTVGDRFYSWDIEPGMSDYIKVQEDKVIGMLNHLPDDVNLKQGALIEPTNVALISLSKTFLQKGQTLAILGGGAIGLLILQIAKAFGAGKIFVSEINPFRIEKAKELGADDVINPLKEDIMSKTVDKLGEGLDAVIELASTQQTFNQMLDLLKPHGKGVIVSWWEKEITIDPNKLVRKNLQITGSKSPNTRNVEWMREKIPNVTGFEFAATLMQEGKIKKDPLISSIVPLDKTDEAFQKILGGNELKILVHP
ncbi:MAG: zinc-dependent alcohol dehydrogenase [Promethearchaeota archaeon]